MDKDKDFMCYFLDTNKQLWQMIGYCPFPTVILQNVNTKEQQFIVPDSPIAQSYTKLVPEIKENKDEKQKEN